MGLTALVNALCPILEKLMNVRGCDVGIHVRSLIQDACNYLDATFLETADTKNWPCGAVHQSPGLAAVTEPFPANEIGTVIDFAT
jgi:hypothetical protein